MGGLLASVLLAKAGKEVLLLEQHSVPGGYCTSYRRNEFIFDIPNILTSIADGELNSILRSLGFFDQVELVELDNVIKFIYPDFEVVLPSNDLEGCRDILKTTFPTEKLAVDNVFSEIAKLQKNIFSMQKTGKSIRDIISFVSTVPAILLLTRKSLYDYLRKFTDNEKLIEVLSGLWGFTGLPSKNTRAFIYLMMIGECYGKPVYFPRDGYQSISDFLANKLLEFGGEIMYRTRVSNILIKDKKAIGVKTATDDVYHAEAVISNADTKKTFLELVGRQNLSHKFLLKIDAHRPSASGISLQIGTSLDLSKFDLKYGIVFYNESWESNSYFHKAAANKIDLANDDISISLRASSLLSDRLAPEGMHNLRILLYPLSREYMQGSGVLDGERGDEYRKIKDRLSDILIKKAESIIPGLSKSIIIKELSTPYTFEHYTGSTNGAWFDSAFPISQKFQNLSSKTPIENLYLTGTKAFGGGGLPSALRGGIKAVKAILRK